MYSILLYKGNSLDTIGRVSLYQTYLKHTLSSSNSQKVKNVYKLLWTHEKGTLYIILLYKGNCLELQQLLSHGQLELFTRRIPLYLKVIVIAVPKVTCQHLPLHCI